jgi:hypothetical protein
MSRYENIKARLADRLIADRPEITYGQAQDAAAYVAEYASRWEEIGSSDWGAMYRDACSYLPKIEVAPQAVKGVGELGVQLLTKALNYFGSFQAMKTNFDGCGAFHCARQAGCLHDDSGEELAIAFMTYAIRERGCQY